MFKPPFCPHADCYQHRHAEPGFCIRKGFFRPKIRSFRVQRYLCKHCNRGFSRQTFRADYRHRRPDLNAAVFKSLATGVGLRQTARNLGMARTALERKARKLGAHFRDLNLNLRSSLGKMAEFQFDEFETFEGCRNTRPLSVPMLIETQSRFVIWAESAPIRPKGTMTKSRLARIRRHEAKFGPRKDLSRESILRTLARGRELLPKGARILIETDEKTSYPYLIHRAFPDTRIDHSQTNSRRARNIANPLFPINNMEAMARDLMGRLRRQSWLASKMREYLDPALQMWMAYRNYVRRRFNRKRGTPAQYLGFVKRQLSCNELISWRQDWGERSIHPLSRGGRLVGARGLSLAA